MTEAELADAVNAYFASHLDAAFWGGLSAAAKDGAVAMAQSDILAELPGITLADIPADSFALKAIAEQAVYLARNYDRMTEGKVLTSESVEGLSEGYTLINTKVGMSFRAEAFLKRAKSAFSGATLRVVRG